MIKDKYIDRQKVIITEFLHDFHDDEIKSAPVDIH